MTSDEKFGKKEHILKPSDFRKAYKGGRSFKKNALVLYAFQNKCAESRIGFSISSRSVKNAIARNKIRRRLREIYRLNKTKLKTGFDLVVVVKKDISRETSYKGIEEIFLSLAESARLLKAA